LYHQDRRHYEDVGSRVPRKFLSTKMHCVANYKTVSRTLSWEREVIETRSTIKCVRMLSYNVEEYEEVRWATKEKRMEI
jgi:hypothetical protein